MKFDLLITTQISRTHCTTLSCPKAQAPFLLRTSKFSHWQLEFAQKWAQRLHCGTQSGILAFREHRKQSKKIMNCQLTTYTGILEGKPLSALQENKSHNTPIPVSNGSKTTCIWNTTRISHKLTRELQNTVSSYFLLLHHKQGFYSCFLVR